MNFHREAEELEHTLRSSFFKMKMSSGGEMAFSGLCMCCFACVAVHCVFILLECFYPCSDCMFFSVYI